MLEHLAGCVAKSFPVQISVMFLTAYVHIFVSLKSLEVFTAPSSVINEITVAIFAHNLLGFVCRLTVYDCFVE